MMRTLEREQWLPIPIEQAWEFFSSPKNLAKITPGDMGFVIREPFDNAPIYEGQRISYTVRPLFGIPLKWITCIAVAEEPYRFVDVQVRGPYRHWWHEHTFSALDSTTTVMVDVFRFAAPLGPAGLLAEHLILARYMTRLIERRSRWLTEALEDPGMLR